MRRPPAEWMVAPAFPEEMMRRAVLIAFFALVAVMPAFAQSSDPSWLEDLNFQIEGQKQCKVAYLIQVREGELGGKKTYEARVQCEDGRMFDAVRVGEFESFKFKACEQQVC